LFLLFLLAGADSRNLEKTIDIKKKSTDMALKSRVKKTQRGFVLEIAARRGHDARVRYYQCASHLSGRVARPWASLQDPPAAASQPAVK